MKGMTAAGVALRGELQTRIIAADREVRTLQIELKKGCLHADNLVLTQDVAKLLKQIQTVHQGIVGLIL